MRIRWKGLELPTRVVADAATMAETYGRFVAEPFERGFGVTIGNSLRRILLSSLEGAAVTGVKMEGVLHEFSSIEGVIEDVTDIILNVKGLVVRLEGDEPRIVTLAAAKAGPVTAAKIQTDPNVEIINKNHLLATLSKDVDFRLELRIAKGRGYVAAEQNTPEEQEIGYIPVDSLYSPVVRVRYRTEDTRVGQRTNYDRLVMEIWTNGTVTPEMALVEAAKIMRKHLNPFVEYFQPGEELGAEVVPVAEEAAGTEEYVSELERKLAMPISSLELSIRAANCLEAENIMTVGQLVRLSEEDLLNLRSFGKTSLREIKRKLADLGLSIGMDLEGVTAGGGGGSA
ncbi:MAG: DNA-directed RNA polymerase subunit alpha [Planctomycetota bacterium]|nr:DNA-directed RNA polymerase subunit alpha [Planctomycetota bacterium]